MAYPTLELGKAYRLVRPFEVRDDKTGTIRSILRKETIVQVKRIKPEEDHVWVEGVNLPLPLSALRIHVRPE